MKNLNPKFSIVIPAYAEEKYIGSTLIELKKYLKENNWLKDTEVIVVTANASDKTQDIVKKMIVSFPLHQHVQPGVKIGKGRDVKAGLSVAKGEYVVFMDADMATPLKYLRIIFELLENQGGMTIGVRQINSMHKSFFRRYSSITSNILIRSFIGWDISDSQCGFKGFDKKSLRIILERSKIDGWGFDFEFIKIAKIHRIKISKIVLPDWHDPKPEGQGLSGDTQFKAMYKTFKELFITKINQIRGVYK